MKLVGAIKFIFVSIIGELKYYSSECSIVKGIGSLVIGEVNFVARNAFVATAHVKVLGLLLCGTNLRPADVIAHVAGRVDWHVVSVPDRAASAMQTLFAPLVASHVVVRLLTHLVVDYTPAAHVINLLHVLPATTSAYHP